jgi:UDP-glucose:(heptosyl)LPS alpha-1,3-glucosyltransferase
VTDDALRVAVVCRRLDRAQSIGRDAFLLAAALRARGVEVHAYCDPETSAPPAGVEVHPVRSLTRSSSRVGFGLERGSFALAATWALRRDRARYDVIHVCSVDAWEHDVVRAHAVTRADQERWPSGRGQGHRLARLRARASPALRPAVGVSRAVERLQYRAGAYRRVLAVTEEVRSDLIRVHGVASEAIQVVAPPVPVEAIASAVPGALRSRLGLDPEARLLLFIGHSFERKGLGDALTALAELDRDVHLAVVGDGRGARFEAAAARLGLERRVHFLGSTSEPETAYPDADVFVFPTLEDPWGMPIVEAMAAGVPIVTTTVAGAAETARRCGAALVVPPSSPRALREALASLLADPARRRQMGERGRVGAVPFGPDAYADAVLAACRGLPAGPLIPREPVLAESG